MTTEASSWLKPDGKRKHKRVDRVNQDQRFWEQRQRNANAVLPQFELSVPAFISETSLVPKEDKPRSPTYPADKPPIENVLMGGAKDD